MLAELSIHAETGLPVVKGRLDPASAREVAKEFEAVFLSSMMQHMFAGVSTDAPFGGGQAEETWRSLMIEEYGKSFAASGGIGIADNIARELLSLQEMEVTEDAR